jgi:hypothetical protein
MIQHMIYKIVGLFRLCIGVCPRCKNDKTVKRCDVCRDYHKTHDHNPSIWFLKSWYRRYIMKYEEEE